MEDKCIIELYNRRDEKAITETSKKYGDYCFSIANNILANRQDSEECVNDTWLRTWNSIPPARPDSLKLFLAKITRNLSFNRYNERKAEKRGGGETVISLEEISELVSGVSDPTDELMEEELMRTVNTFLRKASKRDRGIFVCRYFYVEPVKRIAQKYGVSESNVHKILSRMRIRLKEHLEKEGYGV